MVQYILTPWRDRQELLLVREQFYNVASNSQQREQEQSANTRRNRVPPRVSSGDDGDTQPGGVGAAEPPSFANMHSRSQPGQDETGKTHGQRHRQRQAVVRVSMWMQRGNCPHVVESTALLTAAMLSDDGLLAGSAYAVRAAYSAAFSRYVPQEGVPSVLCFSLPYADATSSCLLKTSPRRGVMSQNGQGCPSIPSCVIQSTTCICMRCGEGAGPKTCQRLLRCFPLPPMSSSINCLFRK